MGSEELKTSSEKIGQLYPVLVDYYGKIVDGEHRLEANREWHRITLGHIKTEKDRLVARIIGNNVRRIVPQREKRLLLRKLGEILLDNGIPPGKIAYKIAEETGMSYRWVMKYLPAEFKDETQSERASGAARHAAVCLYEVLKPPKNKGAVVIKSYVNADFVSLTIEKRFYEEFERNSLGLDVPAETSVLKALEDYNAKMKSVLILKNKSKMNDEKYLLNYVLSPKA